MPILGSHEGNRFAAKHMQPIEWDYNKASVFLNCRCAVLLKSLLPITASSYYLHWVQTGAPLLNCAQITLLCMLGRHV